MGGSAFASRHRLDPADGANSPLSRQHVRVSSCLEAVRPGERVEMHASREAWSRPALGRCRSRHRKRPPSNGSFVDRLRGALAAVDGATHLLRAGTGSATAGGRSVRPSPRGPDIRRVLAPFPWSVRPSRLPSSNGILSFPCLFPLAASRSHRRCLLHPCFKTSAPRTRSRKRPASRPPIHPPPKLVCFSKPANGADGPVPGGARQPP